MLRFFRLFIVINSLVIFFSQDLFSANVKVSWNDNSESDLAGYQVYVGATSGSYTNIFNANTETAYTVPNLTEEQTYYFAVTAYDQSGNESTYSTEKSLYVRDKTAPQIQSVTASKSDLVIVVFSEDVDSTTAEIVGNYTYTIDQNIIVQTASLQADNRTVHLSTLTHAAGSYTLTVNNVRDNASLPNTIVSNSTFQYTFSSSDVQGPQVTNCELFLNSTVVITFNEDLNSSTAQNTNNYSINNSINVISISYDAQSDKVFLTTDAHVPGTSYLLTISNVTDISGNLITGDTQLSYDCVSSDNQPPTFIAARVIDKKWIELEFGEALNTTTAQNTRNYSIQNVSTQNLIAVATASYDAATHKVTLETGEHSDGGYSVTVNGVEDLAGNAISSGVRTYTFTSPDQTRPVLEKIILASDKLLKLYFSEKLDHASASDQENYTITCITNSSITIKVDDASVMSDSIVFLETNTTPHVKGQYSVSVHNVDDLSENQIGSNAALPYPYDPPDQTKPTITNVQLYYDNLLQVSFSEAISPQSAENKNNYGIDFNVTIDSVLLVGQDAKKVNLYTTKHGIGSYQVVVNNISDLSNNIIKANSSRPYNYTVPDQSPPQLTGASLTGTQNLTLHFSEPVTKATAEVSDNYKIVPSVFIQQATLDISSQIVTILTDPHTPNQNYTITIVNIKDWAGNSIQSSVYDSRPYPCISVDNAAPVLQYARSKGDSLVELCFDEVLDETSATTKTNYYINRDIQIYKAEISPSRKEVLLTTSLHPYTGEYQVSVQNVKDIATPPYTMSMQTAPYFYVAEDSTAPILVNVTLGITNNNLELQFNEALNPETAKEAGNYRIGDGSEITIDKVFYDPSNHTVILQTTEHLSTGTYTVHVKNIQDVISPDNVISPVQKNYVFTKEDNAGPVIQSAECRNGNLVEVIFDESLELISGSTKLNYTIKPFVEIDDVIYRDGQKQVQIQTDDHAAGDYTLTISGVKDDTESGNRIIDYSQVKYRWNPPDTTAPVLIGRELVQNTGIKLYFSEPINLDGIVDTSHYQIRPKVKVIDAAQTTSNLKVIWLLTEPHPEGNYTLTVNGLKDCSLDPHFVDPNNNSVQYAYTLPDTSAPRVDTVMCRSSMLLVVQFDEKVDRSSAENVTHYPIDVDGVDITNVTLMIDRQTVHLETTPHQGNKNYTLNITGIQDCADQANIMTRTQSVVYQYLPPDDTAPTISNVKYDNSEVRVEFSEPVEQTSAVNRNNYEIRFGMEVDRVKWDPSEPNRVTITTSTLHLPMNQYHVFISNVKDIAGNAIVSGSWKTYSPLSTGALADNAPPEFLRIEMRSSTQLTLVFSEALNKAEAENIDHYFIDDTIAVKNAVLDSNLTRVLLTTTPHDYNQAYNILITGLQDRASNVNIMSAGKNVSYIYANGVGLSTLNKSEYEFGVLRVGAYEYWDRDYSYSVAYMPEELEGAMQVRTANNDKTSKGNDFLSFELAGDAMVYIAYDAGIDTIPQWLTSWKPTGDQIIDSRQSVFNIYSKSYSNSQVVLGGNEDKTTDNNMYQVYVRPYQSGSAIITGLSKTSYQTAHLEIGDAYYIDREYKLASIPDSLEGLLWVKTALEDKTTNEDNFLQFEITSQSKIYIAYDARVKNKNWPAWLDDWNFYENGQVVDSRGHKFNVFYQDYEPGIVTLGSNEGSIDDNMYLVLIQSAGELDPYRIANMPGYFTLSQNYPNPFNPDTRIHFTIHKPGHLTLVVYNLLGQQVKVLVDREIDEFGLENVVTWDGTNRAGIPVASGIYFYRIKHCHFVKTRKMLLVR